MNKLFVFDRSSACILSKEWETNETANSPASSIGKNSTSSGRSTIEIGLEDGPAELSSTSLQEYPRNATSNFLSAKDASKSKPKGSFISDFLPNITKSFSKLAFSDTSKKAGDNALNSVSDESQLSKNTLTIREQYESTEQSKLVFGLVYTLANITKKLSSKNEPFYCYKTGSYVLYHLETPTSYRFVLLAEFSSVFAGVGKEILDKIYKGPFMEYVIKNPLQPISKEIIGQENEKFHQELNKLISKYA